MSDTGTIVTQVAAQLAAHMPASLEQGRPRDDWEAFLAGLVNNITVSGGPQHERKAAAALVIRARLEYGLAGDLGVLLRSMFDHACSAFLLNDDPTAYTTPRLSRNRSYKSAREMVSKCIESVQALGPQKAPNRVALSDLDSFSVLKQGILTLELAEMYQPPDGEPMGAHDFRWFTASAVRLRHRFQPCPADKDAAGPGHPLVFYTHAGINRLLQNRDAEQAVLEAIGPDHHQSFTGFRIEAEVAAISCGLYFFVRVLRVFPPVYISIGQVLGDGASATASLPPTGPAPWSLADPSVPAIIYDSGKLSGSAEFIRHLAADVRRDLETLRGNRVETVVCLAAFLEAKYPTLRCCIIGDSAGGEGPDPAWTLRRQILRDDTEHLACFLKIHHAAGPPGTGLWAVGILCRLRGTFQVAVLLPVSDRNALITHAGGVMSRALEGAAAPGSGAHPKTREWVAGAINAQSVRMQGRWDAQFHGVTHHTTGLACAIFIEWVINRWPRDACVLVGGCRAMLLPFNGDHSRPGPEAPVEPSTPRPVTPGLQFPSARINGRTVKHPWIEVWSRRVEAAYHTGSFLIIRGGVKRLTNGERQAAVGPECCTAISNLDLLT